MYIITSKRQRENPEIRANKQTTAVIKCVSNLKSKKGAELSHHANK